MKILPLLLSLLIVSCAHAAPVPPEIKAAIPKSSISLRFETKAIGPNGSPIGLHLSVVPTDRNKGAYEMLGQTPKTGPITRDEITAFDMLTQSPFTLDVYAQKSGKWSKINSVNFSQSKDVQEINTRWLNPKRKIGPVLLLHFGYTHWHEWEVITFPQGLQAPAAHQTFLWGGEGEYNYVGQKFDKTDASGRMIITEEESEGVPDGKNGEKQKLTKNTYYFNGNEWINPKTRYFVIGASAKTRTEADKIFKKIGFGEVRPSSEYKGLKSGYYVLIFGRYSNLKQAQEQVKYLKANSKVESYVKKAF